MKSIYLIIGLFSLLGFSQETNQFDQNGKRHGVWKGVYEESKRPRYEGTFDHGKEVGTFKFFDDTKAATIIATREFYNKDNSCYTIFYNQKGNKVSEGKEVNKLMEGEWKYYHLDSPKIMTIENYLKGKLNGLRKVLNYETCCCWTFWRCRFECCCLFLQEQGYEVIGLFMKNWHDDSVTISDECPWLEDSNDALLVAEKLGIPFQTVDLSEQYKEKIVDYMFNEYEKGRTPNPDVLCNREIKFDVFMKIAFLLVPIMLQQDIIVEKEKLKLMENYRLSIAGRERF
jgi:hypothetical protein